MPLRNFHEIQSTVQLSPPAPPFYIMAPVPLKKARHAHAHQITQKTLEQVVDEYGRYPFEAFEFVRLGLNQTVQQIHGDVKAKAEVACHISGQQLSWGLRNFAVQHYGIMAKRSCSIGESIAPMILAASFLRWWIPN